MEIPTKIELFLRTLSILAVTCQKTSTVQSKIRCFKGSQDYFLDHATIVLLF